MRQCKWLGAILISSSLIAANIAQADLAEVVRPLQNTTATSAPQAETCWMRMIGASMATTGMFVMGAAGCWVYKTRQVGRAGDARDGAWLSLSTPPSDRSTDDPEAAAITVAFKGMLFIAGLMISGTGLGFILVF